MFLILGHQGDWENVKSTQANLRSLEVRTVSVPMSS